MYSSSSAATPTSLSWGLVDNEGDGDGGESMTTFWEHKEDDSSIWNNSTPNSTIELELPIDMQFNAGHVLSIVVYSVLFVLSAIGKVAIIFTKTSMITINICNKQHDLFMCLPHISTTYYQHITISWLVYLNISHHRFQELHYLN